MIVDERMVTYIRSLEVPESAVIEAIEQKTDADFGSRSCGWFFVNSYE